MKSTIKKFLLSSAAAIGIAVIVPVATLAASAFTNVTGVITYNGTPVGKGVKVTVKCNGNKLTDKTDKTGTYFVQFTKQECKKGSTVTTSATVNGHKGSSTGTANEVTNKLNLAIVPVNVVPEFGLVGLTGATLIGGAAFMVMRRRQLGDSQA